MAEIEELMGIKRSPSTEIEVLKRELVVALGFPKDKLYFSMISGSIEEEKG